ncbi:hypothetical protein ACFSVJ_01320 [Prauserella oleivorans]
MLALVILYLPRLVVSYDLAGMQVTAQQRLTAIGDARRTMLQAIGGVVVFYSAYVAWRRLRLNQEELQATRDGQVTERFTRAIDQLGDGALDVRMGGIYALWRIGETSARDWEPVIAMMAAFVRTHSPWPPPIGATDVSTEAINQLPPLESRAPDVQAALTALGVLCHKGALRSG